MDPANTIRELNEDNNVATKSAVFGKLDVIVTFDDQAAFGITDQATGNVTLRFHTTQRALPNYAFGLPVDYYVPLVDSQAAAQLQSLQNFALSDCALVTGSEVVSVTPINLSDPFHSTVGFSLNLGVTGELQAGLTATLTEELNSLEGFSLDTGGFSLNLFNIGLRTNSTGIAPFKVPYDILGLINDQYSNAEAFARLSLTSCQLPVALPTSIPLDASTPTVNASMPFAFPLGGLSGLSGDVVSWVFGNVPGLELSGFMVLSPPPAALVPCVVLQFLPNGTPTLPQSVPVPALPSIPLVEVEAPPTLPNVANVPGTYLATGVVQWSGLNLADTVHYTHIPTHGGDVAYTTAQVAAINALAFDQVNALKATVGSLNLFSAIPKLCGSNIGYPGG